MLRAAPRELRAAHGRVQAVARGSMGGATPLQEVAAGVFAGVADAVGTHPVDVVKTQFHVNPAANGSMAAALASQARAGGLRSLYRGLLPACLRPQALCMYTGNEWAKARSAAAAVGRVWRGRIVQRADFAVLPCRSAWSPAAAS